MNLQELIDINKGKGAIPPTKEQTCDPCRKLLGPMRDTMNPNTRFLDRVPSDAKPDIIGVSGGNHIIIVVNEEGLSEYKIMHPDGHLGSVSDDC